MHATDQILKSLNPSIYFIYVSLGCIMEVVALFSVCLFVCLFVCFDEPNAMQRQKILVSESIVVQASVVTKMLIVEDKLL